MSGGGELRCQEEVGVNVCVGDPVLSSSFFFPRAWGGRFLVFSRISLRVGRIEAALRSRSSMRDFCVLPYFSFQEWYACRVGRCSSG